MRFHFNRIIMKKRKCNSLVAIVAIILFCACSSDENTYYSDAAIESKFNTSAVENSRLNSDIDYEIIPVGENNFVYLPKMASAKVVTRSAEAANPTYSANVSLTVYDNMTGPVNFTVSWDSHRATFSMPDKYSYAYEIFQYSIDGNALIVERLSFDVLYENANLGRFVYIGTLRG